MQSTLQHPPAAAVIRIFGRLDAISAPDFEQECNSRIAQGHTHLVADFSQVNYLSSAGLRSILAITKRLKPLGGKLAVCCLQPMVHEVFSVSGFACYVPIYATLEEALAGPSAG